LSDREWLIFKQLGGAEWLRETLDKKAPMPKKYYDAFLDPLTGETNALCKQTPPVQERIRTTERSRRTPQANGTTES
jgi:hypothetical protein